MQGDVFDTVVHMAEVVAWGGGQGGPRLGRGGRRGGGAGRQGFVGGMRWSGQVSRAGRGGAVS